MHLCNVSSFWTQLAPQLSHIDEAVKHSLVTLGATYYLCKLKSGKRSHVASITIEKLELFVMRQYNRAIENVYKHLEKNDPKSIVLVLVCCLIFISLEFLRANHGAAIAHLHNGIQIIISLIDIKRLSTTSFSPWTKDLALSEADIWDIVTQFRNIEFALNVFSTDVSLTLGRHLRKLSISDHEHDNDPTSISITTLSHGYNARIEFMNNVMSRYSELQSHQGDTTFWDQPHMQRELYTLRERGAKIMLAIEALWASPQAPPVGTWGSYSSRMDWLLVSTCRIFIEMIPFGVHSPISVIQKSYIQDELTTGVSLAAKMHQDHAETGQPPSEFSLETGMIAMMYWAWVLSTRPETKAAALRILQDLDKKEGPWDANQILATLPKVAKPRLLIS